MRGHGGARLRHRVGVCRETRPPPESIRDPIGRADDPLVRRVARSRSGRSSKPSGSPSGTAMPIALGGPRPGDRPRRDLWPPGPERSGEDHDAQPCSSGCCGRPRVAPASRASTSLAHPIETKRRVGYLPEQVLALRAALRRREPRVLRRPRRPAADPLGAAGAARRCRALRWRRGRSGLDVLPGDAAAGRAGDRARPRSRRAPARRAVERSGPGRGCGADGAAPSGRAAGGRPSCSRRTISSGPGDRHPDRHPRRRASRGGGRHAGLTDAGLERLYLEPWDPDDRRRAGRAHRAPRRPA